MNYKSRAIARELIAQQSDDFADQLTVLFEQVYQCQNPREAQQSPACAAIVALVKKRLNMKITLIFNTRTPPATMSVLANSRHVLSVVMFEDGYAERTEDFKAALRNSPVKKGIVDLKNARLGGVYSEISSPVWMSFQFCKAFLTPRQAVALFVHELGHNFLAYEMMYRTVRASQILASLHQVRTKRDTSITYEHAIELAGVDLTGNPREFIQCVTMKNDTAICSVVFAQVYHKLATDFGDNAVSGVNFEALSDNFAAKFGLGADLAQGLTVFETEYTMGRVDGFVGFLLYIQPLVSVFFKSIVTGAVSGAVLGALGGGFAAALALGSIVAAFGVTSGVAKGTIFAGRSDKMVVQTNVYDQPVTRLRRIRESVVQQLKYLELEHEQRARLLHEIQTIDAILKGGSEVFTVFDDMSKIFTSNRRADFAFKLERDIELLANNDLFVNAQRLALKA